MERWDGELFLKELQLSPEKTVLEIGIGTGRLALKTAPLCRHLTGIDLSPKTIERAKIHLSRCPNVTLICDDFLLCPFEETFDRIYASLCFMHIQKKQEAMLKIRQLLHPGGKFVLSIDKNQQEYIDTGNRRLRIAPDRPEAILRYMRYAGLAADPVQETDFAYIISAYRDVLPKNF